MEGRAVELVGVPEHLELRATCLLLFSHCEFLEWVLGRCVSCVELFEERSETLEHVVRFLTGQEDVNGSSGGTLEDEQESELAARDARGKTWWSRERQKADQSDE